jgi:O-antigen/teichoic acid export membrane protein
VTRTAATEERTQVLPPLPQLYNGLALIGAKVLTMGLGFAFWVVAAREYSQHEVGIAAGVVSAMMLCTQLALLGVGSAFITHFPREQRRPGALLDTSLNLVSALGIAWGAAFLLLAGWAFRQLDVVAHRPLFGLLFVAACVAGTLGILFDQMATALRRGDQALTRNAACAVATLALLGALVALPAPRSAEMVFLPWAVAGLAACVMGVAQLRRALPAYRPRLAVDRPLTRRLVRSGVPNYVLTLAERAPGLVLPVIVAELLSPDANAAWYAAWMMAWVVYIVPIQVGMTIFAEVAHDPGAFHRSVRRGVLCSLSIATAGAVVLALGAHLALSVLGPRYAHAGVEPLRILLLAVLPLTFVQAYFSSCRARQDLREAIVTGWLNAIASVGAAAVAGVTHGLVGMAIAWVAVQYATGLWALWRLRFVSLSMAAEPALPATATPMTP